MNLTPLAKTQLIAYCANMAKSYGVDDVSQQFSVTEPMERQLKAALLESVRFLALITTMDVDQIKGEVVKVGNYGIATGRKKNGRFFSDQGVDGHSYELVETDSCAVVTWATLAVWANSGTANQFMQLMSNNATVRFALDLLRIGFNGTSIAIDSDPVANPMGEDVNKGWHQIVKEKAPDQIVTDEIYFNPDAEGVLKEGEYKTLDAIVTELKNSLIHTSLRNDPRLVVLVGSDLTATAQTKMMNLADKPTERVAAQKMDQNIGGLPAYTPPFFPGKRITVTLLSNLHIYTQRGTRHRKSENVEDRKQHEDKYWRQEGYAIEEFEGYASIDEANMNIGAAPAMEPS
ncbi:major capsid protein [Shewanella hanedai]|uniref:Phage major capsid protein, P2 family n=1 Tax=Shewanella hanedai TaxID=25 RepID=A0A553JM61_SHEHA|nr:phage major capsid protein, P2 family [Shewanella hanedai]TRY13552.1 phage major capsid protein, P2 family [Shewanella hanedai]GGI82182.1 major capsid protein [Shewanella hanedai]